MNCPPQCWQVISTHSVFFTPFRASPTHPFEQYLLVFRSEGIPRMRIPHVSQGFDRAVVGKDRLEDAFGGVMSHTIPSSRFVTEQNVPRPSAAGHGVTLNFSVPLSPKVALLVLRHLLPAVAVVHSPAVRFVCTYGNPAPVNVETTSPVLEDVFSDGAHQRLPEQKKRLVGRFQCAAEWDQPIKPFLVWLATPATYLCNRVSPSTLIVKNDPSSFTSIRIASSAAVVAYSTMW